MSNNDGSGVDSKPLKQTTDQISITVRVFQGYNGKVDFIKMKVTKEACIVDLKVN